jgi:Flagellar hook-length control protein FliK
MSAVQALPTIPAQRLFLPESTAHLLSASGPERPEIPTVAATHAIPLSGPIAAPKGLPIPPPRVAKENPTPVAMPALPEQRVAPTNAPTHAAIQVPEQTTSVSDNPIQIRASAHPSLPHLAVVKLPSQTAAERAFSTRVSPDVLHTPMPKIEAVPAIPTQIAEVEKTIPAELVPPPDTDSTAPSAAPVIPPAIFSPETDFRAPNAIEAGLRLQQPMMGVVPDVSLPWDIIRLPSPIPLTDLPQAIVKIVQSEPANSVELRLDPVELGSVRLTLQGTERDISVVIAVERPDTMELLRKHADQLLNDLRQSGYAGASLTFNMSEQHNPARRETHASPPPDFDLQQQPQPQPLTRPEVRGHSGGLDMRL